MPDAFYAALVALPLSLILGGARQALKVLDATSSPQNLSPSLFWRSITEISTLFLLLTLPFLPILLFFTTISPACLLLPLSTGTFATLLGITLGSAWARGTAHPFFLATARVLTYLLLPLFPLSLLFHWFTLRPRHIFPDEEDEFLEDLEDDVEKLAPEGREMVAGVVEFAGLTVREVMVPRIEVTGVDITSQLVAVSTVIADTGHSRLPVYEGSIDNVVGIVHAKDLLPLLVGSQKELKDILRRANFVPESKRVVELLKEFQHSKTQIAIVVDEYGGTAGIVTLEDLIEEIVGEIHDEYDREEKMLVEVSPGVWRAQGKLDLRELEDKFDLVLDDEDYESLGGYILTQLGRMPQAGDAVENDRLKITVDEVDERRIIWVTMHIKEPTEKEKSEE